MVRRIGGACGVVSALLAYPRPACGAEAPFGTPGQVVITNEFASALAAQHYAGGGPNNATTSGITLKPSADMFVFRGFSLGGHIGYARSWTHIGPLEHTQDDLMWGPRLGYALNLSERLSLWPTIGADFVVSWRHGNSGYETPEPVKQVGLGGGVPLLFHVAPHFFVGVGPSVWSYAVSWSSDRATAVAANALIGGWF